MAASCTPHIVGVELAHYYGLFTALTKSCPGAAALDVPPNRLLQPVLWCLEKWRLRRDFSPKKNIDNFCRETIIQQYVVYHLD